MNSDKQKVEGTNREIKGSANEAAGKLTGDRSQEMKGKLQGSAGEMQRKVGEKTDDRNRDRS